MSDEVSTLSHSKRQTDLLILKGDFLQVPYHVEGVDVESRGDEAQPDDSRAGGQSSCSSSRAEKL